MRVTPLPRKSALRHGLDGFELTIPARRNAFTALFLVLWLTGWCFAEVSTIRQLLTNPAKPPALFLGVWLIGWTLGGGLALYTLLWMLRGRELVSIRRGALVIKRDVMGLGRAKEYDLAYVVNLRASPQSGNPVDWSGSIWWGGGTVAFDYGAKTVRFASSVDEAEAQQIVKELKALHGFRESA